MIYTIYKKYFNFNFTIYHPWELGTIIVAVVNSRNITYVIKGQIGISTIYTIYKKHSHSYYSQTCVQLSPSRPKNSG